jgi:hypothetical protein
MKAIKKAQTGYKRGALTWAPRCRQDPPERVSSRQLKLSPACEGCGGPPLQAGARYCSFECANGTGPIPGQYLG